VETCRIRSEPGRGVGNLTISSATVSGKGPGERPDLRDRVSRSQPSGFPLHILARRFASTLSELNRNGKTTPDMFEGITLRLGESVTARHELEDLPISLNGAPAQARTI
jgi:hypothetical protein